MSEVQERRRKEFKTFPRVTFKGKTYTRIGDALCPNEENYLDMDVSYAHIYPYGIYRFGEKIGEVKDLKPVTEPL